MFENAIPFAMRGPLSNASKVLASHLAHCAYRGPDRDCGSAMVRERLPIDCCRCPDARRGFTPAP
jgi:hypothetical protein